MKPHPRTRKEWDCLRDLDSTQAVNRGLGHFDGPDEEGKHLMLFPGTWHKHIPKGYVLDCIDGTQATVGKDPVDDDTRFGYLAFGIRVRE